MYDLIGLILFEISLHCLLFENNDNFEFLLQLSFMIGPNPESHVKQFQK